MLRFWSVVASGSEFSSTPSQHPPLASPQQPGFLLLKSFTVSFSQTQLVLIKYRRPYIKSSWRPPGVGGLGVGSETTSPSKKIDFIHSSVALLPMPHAFFLCKYPLPLLLRHPWPAQWLTQQKYSLLHTHPHLAWNRLYWGSKLYAWLSKKL